MLLHTSKSLPKEEKTSRQSKVAEAIRRKCYEAQKELASYMQKKAERLSARVKKCCLIAFCLSGSVCCINILIQSRQAPTLRPSSFSQIRFPAHPQPAPGRKSADQPRSNDSTLGRIRNFQSYMDSLGQTDSGKITRDSILAARPGLMDSIARLENTPFK